MVSASHIRLLLKTQWDASQLTGMLALTRSYPTELVAPEGSFVKEAQLVSAAPAAFGPPTKISGRQHWLLLLEEQWVTLQESFVMGIGNRSLIFLLV